MQPNSVLNFDDDLSIFAGVRTLTPAQKSVAADLEGGLAAADVNVLRTASGMGRTTVMQSVHAKAGGTFLMARQFLNLLSRRSPNTLEEAFLDLFTATLNQSRIVFVDDLHLIMEVVSHYNFARTNLINAIMTAVLDEAANRGKKFVFAVNDKNEPHAATQRAILWEMEEFEPEDYAVIADYYLGSAATRLDMAKVHRFAPALTVYQIKNAFLWLGLRHAAPDTDSMIDYLRSRDISRNLYPEAEGKTWSDLKGVDSVIEELEAKLHARSKIRNSRPSYN